jgi:hypothetical protein
MSPFEYVTVLISIILGLGITLVLTGIAEIIRGWKMIKHFGPYHIWIALAFILHLQEWWTMYEFKSVESWTLPSFLFVASYPILLFILANLLFPRKWLKKGVDLKTFYFENYNKFFVCLILLAALSILQNVILSNYMLKDQLVQISILIIFSVMLIRPTKNEVVHTVLASLMLVAMLISLLLTQDSLVISS